MKVPFLDVTREWIFFEDKFLEELKKFGRDGKYVLGPYTEEFEKKFSEAHGYKYGIGVSTGLAALETALLANDIGPGDEVITVANSAVATSLAISRLGAKPVFCDIDEKFLIDVSKIEALVTPRTKAILPVHLFGSVCDMEAINGIVKKNNLIVVEDACQAHGSGYGGPSTINTKAFSFYPTKNLGALGEGGMVITNDEKVRDFVSSYRNYGQKERYNHIIKGTNYRIGALQCAFLGIKLESLKDFVEKRKNIAKKYIGGLSSIDDLVINPFDNTSSYHIFTARVLNGKRDGSMKYLKENEIDTAIYYPTPIHRQVCYKDEYVDIALENTDRFQNEIISLPCYPFMNDDEVEYVIEKVISFFKA